MSIIIKWILYKTYLLKLVGEASVSNDKEFGSNALQIKEEKNDYHDDDDDMLNDDDARW